MARLHRYVAAVSACLIAGSAWGAPITFLAPDNINQTSVSAANPLPTTGAGGGGLTQNQLYNGSTWDNWLDSHLTGAADVYVANVAGVSAAANAFVDGAIVTLGGKPDTATCVANNSLIACIRQVDADIKAPLSAGTNNIGSVIPMAVTPATGAATTVVTGGTANNAVTGPVNGCFLTNPTTASEKLYVNIVGAATTTESINTVALAAGQTFTCVPGQTTNVSVNAATNGHAFSVTKW